MPASRDVFLGPRGAQSPRRTWLPRTEQQPLRRHGGAAGSHRGLRTDTHRRRAETCSSDGSAVLCPLLDGHL